jgi:hypothetical protein
MSRSIKVWSGSSWEDVGSALPAVTSQFIQLTNPASTGYIIRAAASQAANIFQIQNYGVTPLFTIDNSGNLVTSGTITTNNFSTSTGYLTLNSTTANGYFPTITASRSSNDTSLYYNSARIAIQNSSATANNYSSIGFLSANANDVAAIWSQNSVHTTGAASGHLIFGTNNGSGAASERMRITPAGYVGINNASPSYRLDIVGDAGNAVPALAIRPDNNAGIVGVFQRASDGSGTLAFGTSTAHNLSFIANGSEVARVNTAGQWGFGTVNPAYTIDAIVTNSSTTVGSTAQFMRFMSASGNNDMLQFFSQRTTAGSASWTTQDWVIRRLVDATPMSEIRWVAGEYNPITVLLDPTNRGIRTTYIGTSAPSSGTGNNGDMFAVYA